MGAAVLAQKKGFDVFVSDMSAIKKHYKQMLDEYGIVWEESRHTENLILNADEIIKSPGIPQEAPIVQKAMEKGIPIISEIEFAGRYTTAKMICITGSNGKTTTTSLIYHIFKKAGYNVGLAGNIGRSLAFQVAECDFDYYVIELSSFQLDNMYDFKADIAVLMNITPDHLDRYGFKMQNYVDSKMRITRNQTTLLFSGTTTPSLPLNSRSTISRHRCSPSPNSRETVPSHTLRTASTSSSNPLLLTWSRRNWRFVASTISTTPWLQASRPILSG